MNKLWIRLTLAFGLVAVVAVMMLSLAGYGIDTVFGIPGNHTVQLYRGLAASSLRHISPRHEQGAAFMAEVYGRLTGNPAGCLGTLGPGATNLLNGLWDARMDRVPILALTGQVDTQVLGPGAFQEIDLASAFEAVTAFSQTVLPGSRHAELMSLALSRLEKKIGGTS